MMSSLFFQLKIIRVIEDYILTQLKYNNNGQSRTQWKYLEYLVRAYNFVTKLHSRRTR